MEQQVSERAYRSLQDELPNAATRGELFLQYQPIVDVSEKIIGMEALMRWNSAEYGQISPAQFIPLAEQSGAILYMGDWALDESCQQLQRWSRIPMATNWTLSVNVSAHQFNNGHFVDYVLHAVQRYGIASGRLILEITENVFLDSTADRQQDGFRRIREAGVGIAIDDFGTGFSSICYLRNLSVSRIKIARTFIDNVAENKKDQDIVVAIVMLAHALGLDVVAEGVETAEQLKFLKGVGCSAFQGFLFGRPSDVSEFL